MLRGVFISEDGFAQFIGDIKSFRTLKSCVAETLAQVSKLADEELKAELQQLFDTMSKEDLDELLEKRKAE